MSLLLGHQGHVKHLLAIYIKSKIFILSCFKVLNVGLHKIKLEKKLDGI